MKRLPATRSRLLSADDGNWRNERHSDQFRRANALLRHPSERDWKLRILSLLCRCGRSREPPDHFPRNQRMGASASSRSYRIDFEPGTAGSTRDAVVYRVQYLLSSDYENRVIGNPYSMKRIYRLIVC
jgi:hypothetical protein